MSVPLLATYHQTIRLKGYAVLPRAFSSSQPQEAAFLAAWNDLVLDRHMADSGTYRYRRYSRFLLRRSELSLTVQEGSSIFQEIRDNPLNGGVTRTFAPLEKATLENLFLHHIILQDAEMVGLDEAEAWLVGVHMVRIVASSQAPGHPAPEGIHIDAEKFTVQHLIGRENVEGGVFSTYDSAKQPLFHWLQLALGDTVAFTGTTWHGATPVYVRDASREGHRDTLLIDFDPLPV